MLCKEAHPPTARPDQSIDKSGAARDPGGHGGGQLLLLESGLLSKCPYDVLTRINQVRLKAGVI